MSGVLKNRKKKEEAEAMSKSLSSAQDIAFTSPVYPEEYAGSSKKSTGATANAQDTAEVSESSGDEGEKKGGSKRKVNGSKTGKASKATDSLAAAPAARKRKRGGSAEEEDADEENTSSKKVDNGPSNKNAELKINEKGTIDMEDESSDDEDEAMMRAVNQQASPSGEGGEGIGGETAPHRQKKYIKRRLKRYLSLEDKIAVFQRIVHDIDPKTKKLRYGASNEICADYSIGRKTINNIKNLFEGLIREGKDLSSLLSEDTMNEIPSKLNVTLPVVGGIDENGNPITISPADIMDPEEVENMKKLAVLKQNLQSLGTATGTILSLAGVLFLICHFPYFHFCLISHLLFF
jgi:hypothetical protein